MFVLSTFVGFLGGKLQMFFEIFLQYTYIFLQVLKKYKQGFENVINWACSEMRFTVAHPNERGTNIALIILPQNKASNCMQRTVKFHHPFHCWAFLLHFLDFLEGKPLH